MVISEHDYFAMVDEAIDDLCDGRKTFADDLIIALLHDIAGRTAHPALLDELSGNGDELVRGAVAENDACPMRLLANLASDEHEYVRDCAHHALYWVPAEQLFEVPPRLVMRVQRWAQLPRVSRHLAERAAEHAATWSGTTRALLTALEDPAQLRLFECPAVSPVVRPASFLDVVEASVYAPRRHTYRFTEPTLEAFAAAPVAEVQAIASNLDTPSWILEAMVAAGICASEAVANPTCPEHLRVYYAEQPTTPPTLLAMLAGHTDGAVRYGVAENPSTPPAVLARLAGRACRARHAHCHDVLRAAAGNPNTPTEALEPLLTAELPKVAVSRGIAGLPPEAERLAKGLVDGWEGTLGELYETASILADGDHPRTPAPNESVAEAAT